MTGSSPPTGQGAGEGPLHGRHHPHPGGRGRRRGDAGRSLVVAKQFPRLLRRKGLEDQEKLAEAGTVEGRARRAGACCSGVVGVDRLERIFTKLFDEASSSPPTACGPSPPTTATIPTAGRRGPPGDDRLRAGRVDHREGIAAIYNSFFGTLSSFNHGYFEQGKAIFF